MGDIPTLPRDFSDIAKRVPDGLLWSYKATLRAGGLTHTWSLTGERGAIHVDAWPASSPSFGREWYGGIEAHSPIKQSEYGSDKPDHEHCWLLCGPCWHDGSSLQFSEEIAPYFGAADMPMGRMEHDLVLGTMLSRYNSWLPSLEHVEAAALAKERGL